MKIHYIITIKKQEKYILSLAIRKNKIIIKSGYIQYFSNLDNSFGKKNLLSCSKILMSIKTSYE